jgi:hypothetical protein
LLLVENAQTRWTRFAGIELGGSAGRRFRAAGLELREHDGEFAAVTDAFFHYRENGDAGKVGEEMFEFYYAGLEFSSARGLGQFFQLEGLFERKFAYRGARDFSQVRAAA